MAKNEISRPQTANIPPFGLRMQPELKDQVEAAARASGRSMNAEVVARLEASFDALPGLHVPPEMRAALEEEAQANGQTLNNEILDRLHMSLDAPIRGTSEAYWRKVARDAELELELERLRMTSVRSDLGTMARRAVVLSKFLRPDIPPGEASRAKKLTLQAETVLASLGGDPFDVSLIRAKVAAAEAEVVKSLSAYKEALDEAKVREKGTMGAHPAKAARDGTEINNALAPAKPKRVPRPIEVHIEKRTFVKSEPKK